ncbi:MAG TPA: NAD+ synthase [Desulfobacteraceae bacterium]|nr:NAD+ synthase [Desulfobacteraceae bacterium]
MKIGIAQVNPLVGDFAGNAAKIEARAAQARDKGCDLVVFSELVLSGYPPRDLLEKNDFVQAGLAALAHLVKRIRGIGVICGYVDRNPAPEGKPLLNAAVLFENGRIRHRACKRLLPTYDVFDESRYFEPGTDNGVVDFRGRRLALTICEDVWNDKEIFARPLYHSDPVAAMSAAGADLLVNVAASPFDLGKPAFRERMLAAVARKYRLPVVFANQVGGNDSLVFDGASSAFHSDGRLVARASEFAEDLVVFDTAALTGQVRSRSATTAEAVYRALVCGTRDYVTKCGFHKVVIGLSGGIDSALTACIAAEAFGPSRVHTVFMPSRYTSRDNFVDTETLAANLGVGYQVIPIDEIFDAFARPLCPDFDPARPGITEQNIQARIRGTLLMGISNRDGSLVLSTGNKSELAVGYCTLYGDMNGGLAVISDVPKTLVYQISRYVNRGGEIIPRRIIDKAPSAELAPDQADQDDLPPYDLLDRILEGYVERRKSAADLAAEGFAPDLVQEVIRRVDRSEYKRRQAAPGIKVTAKAFGEGWRLPLAKRFVPLE